MKQLKDYQLNKTTLDKYHLNYWEFWGNFSNDDNEEFFTSEFGYNSFHDMCIDVREDYKTNRELHKCKTVNEPLCYYYARYMEWNDKEKCYYYTEYKLSFRKGKIKGRTI